MTAAKKLIEAAGNAGGEAVYVDDVFSTYLYELPIYTSNPVNVTINPNWDYTSEDSMVWIKSRDYVTEHAVFDTLRGNNKRIDTDTGGAETNTVSSSGNTASFTSSGFAIAGDATTSLNYQGSYASWTFRKAPGFFDVVTYTGDGVAGRTVDHNLGCEPGFIIVKRTNNTGNWYTWHTAPTSSNNRGILNSTGNFDPAAALFGDGSSYIAPTSTTFTVSSYSEINGSGDSFVAYLFADGDDAAAQIFGDNGDQAVVKCGSYTGDGTTDGSNTVSLGFEPQWILAKPASGTGSWLITDVMRGLTYDAGDALLFANNSNAEIAPSTTYAYFGPTADGFAVSPTTTTGYNGSGVTYIYIAIRRPHKPAETGSEVYNAGFLRDTNAIANDVQYYSGFPVDAAIFGNRTGNIHATRSRLTGYPYLDTASTAAETGSVSDPFGTNHGLFPNTSSSYNSDLLMWMFKRSPGFFDVVCYEGNNNTSRDAIKHNLNAIPEMIILKPRESSNTYPEWSVYHHEAINSAAGDEPIELRTLLNSSAASIATSSTWGYPAKYPTEDEFYVGSVVSNESNYPYIAYLFASQDGISKVGSYTGNGSTIGDTQDIDCGFSTGARFVLIKSSTRDPSNWLLYDTERGITASADDPKLSLNDSNPENTNDNCIEPNSSGFTVRFDSAYADDTNIAGETYIYLAIA